MGTFDVHEPDDAPAASSEPATVRLSELEAAAAAPGSAYVVEIAYREPGYAERVGEAKSYSGRFLVIAPDEARAIAQAKAEFEATAVQSGVGWAREIERIACRPAGEG